jgi:hypothetical protein
VLVGMTVVFAGHAARAGARALAVGDAAGAAAVGDLPGSWQKGAQVSQSTDNSGYGQVNVALTVPVLVPGLKLPLLSIHSSAGTVIEDQLLAGESPGWTLTAGPSSPLAGRPPVTGLALLSSPFFKWAPGNVPVLEPNGFLEAPHGLPRQVLELIAAANEINSFPYPNYPDGVAVHYFNDNLSWLWPAYDCSGSTSFVLYAANLRGVTATDSTGLEGYDSSGPGKWVTIYANADHVHIVIDGYNFDTVAGAGANAWPPDLGFGGPRWQPAQDASDYSGFVVSHPTGY